MKKEFADAVTKEPNETTQSDITPTRLTPYLPANKPAGKPNKTPGSRTMEMTALTSVKLTPNTPTKVSNKGDAVCRQKA
jgi:hypothetical protein